jgi:cob(I)alamin adenosyltransferase
VAAYGSVDELNAVLGLLRAQLPDSFGAGSVAILLRTIQNDLFDVGADLCLPQPADESTGHRLRVQPEQTVRLETAIDCSNAKLTPLTSFVLPGGTPGASWCHLARTVCRRAEREIVALARTELVNPQVVIYLNRLSDFLFVLARVLNNNGKEDVLWKPGESQKRKRKKPKRKRKT